MDKVPLAKPFVGEEEAMAAAGVVRSGFLSLGPKLDEFEKNFREFIGTKHAVAVNSGTSGLEICIKALNLKKGDEVITTSFSFVASSNPVVLENAKPVFIDIDEKTYNMDISKVKQAVNKKTKAIMAVHIFGQPLDVEALIEAAPEAAIIEDACEAPGAQFNGRMAGKFGKAAVFGFYPNKQITTGEGGMIVTDCDEMAKVLRSLRNQGRDDCGEWLNHVRLGHNYRLDEMSCAVGIEQLKKINTILKLRKELADKYTNRFKDVKGLVVPYTDPRVKRSWWVYYLRAEEGYNRNKIIGYLNEQGISSRGYFDPPIHLQPIYRNLFGYRGGELPVTEKVSKSGFIIPFFIGMTEEQIERVCITVCEAVRRAKI
ncbi:MAG: DegT/DnrJ/EryC1/StrS family aminotransferase [Candidatus Omnitrophota bacterium]